MNNIIKRPYKILSDFLPVYDFLGNRYTLSDLNGMMIPQFFEYAHTHCCFNKNMTHRMTVWQREGGIVAFCGYEMDLGEAYLVVSDGFEELLPEMLSQAEKELSVCEDGVRSLEVWTTETQSALTALLKQSGYAEEYSEPVTIYRYANGFKPYTLPDGFTCVSLESGIDFRKLNRCTWRGFDHGDDVEYDIDEMRYMANGSHHRPDLGRVIIAPDGEYACYAGMWFDEKNKYAYLEPLCTQPEYRKMGLARYALTSAMKQTRSLGAEYCFGGDIDFYLNLGFEVINKRVLFRKVL